MRFVSTVALGLMLAVAGGAVTTPAIAKEKKEKEVKPQYSDAFIKEAQAVQKLNDAKDYPGMKAALEKAEAAATTPDDKLLVGQFHLNLGIGTSDAALQRQGLKEMLATGKVSADNAPQYNFFAGKLALDAKDYDDAIPYLQKAVDAGYEGSSAQLLLAETYFQKAIRDSGGNGQLNDASKLVAQQGLPYLKKAIEMEKAAGKAVPAGWYERGFSIAYVSGSPNAAEWSRMNLEANPTPKNWRNLLLTFQTDNPTLTRSENLDVLRLMRQTKALEGGSIGEYVDIATKSGLLGEVKGVIEESRAAGKIGSAQLQDYYTPAVEGMAKDKASLNPNPATAKAAVSNGDAYFSYGDYAKAISLYRSALEKGGVDVAEVNTRLGIALALSGDMAGAKSTLEQVTTGARKAIAEYWLLWLSTKQAA